MRDRDGGRDRDREGGREGGRAGDISRFFPRIDLIFPGEAEAKEMERRTRV